MDTQQPLNQLFCLGLVRKLSLTMANDKDNRPNEATGEVVAATGCSSSDSATGVAKTLAQLKKEAEKQAKLAKFQQKQAKMAQQQQQKAAKAPAEAKKEKGPTTIIYEGKSTPGEKKDLSGPMPDSYSPDYVEAAWYSWWEKSGFFKPEINCPDLTKENPKGKFTMVIPPPNVTGSLHLGHALTVAIEDCIIRWNRMRGLTTLWAPGCDHAGIATQVVVEKKIWRDEQKTRHDLGREQFVQRVWKWKNEKGDRIYDQFRLLGASVDWDRVTFTMDEKMNRAVNENFVRLHEKGLIYRANRLVNWCCALRSSISDIEVDKIDIPGRTFLSVPGYTDKVEFGVLHLFAYKVEASDDELVVATTRIETMLGDTAIAVHPNDDRYRKFHGKFAVHPFIPDRKLLIVADDFVDMNFGTGAVKITPAHDPNDYECGKRFNLPFITIFDDNGNVTSGCGQFSGLPRFTARKQVLAALKDLGLYRDTKDNPMVVPLCSRSKDIIEPMLKVQWYLNCTDMAARAVDAVKTGQLKLIPESHNKVWFNWLENIRDWCISRQLWWGHRIPAYKVTISGRDMTTVPDDDRWISARTEQEALDKAVAKFSVTKDTITLEQDEDVLDTWFSSGLFPLSSFGWPEETSDFKNFYPGHLLETGYDIIFFWVARMVMLGLQLTDKLPFTEVFLHSIVRDAHGRKMSKSLGNVIDPVAVIKGITLEQLHATLMDGNLDAKEIEKAKAGQKADFPQGIPQCGTDALRFALCSYLTQGRDINLDIKRVEGYRFFCNKIWNAFKLTSMQLANDFTPLDSECVTGFESPLDLWMLSRVSVATDSCNTAFRTYDFPLATQACYNLWLYELCDIYLEAIKPIMFGTDETAKVAVRQTLYSTVSVALRLVHPFMPYITEELFQRLPRRKSETCVSICIAQYPQVDHFKWQRNEQLEKDVSLANQVVHNIRSIRADYNLAKTKVKVSVKCDTAHTADRLRPFLSTIGTLSLAESVEEVSHSSSAPTGTAAVPVNESVEAYLHLKGVIDPAKETERLIAKKSKVEGPIAKLIEAMAAKDYQQKVPQDVRDANDDRLRTMQLELKKIEQAMQAVNLMS